MSYAKAQSPCATRSLHPEIYISFLSDAARERKPSPSMCFAHRERFTGFRWITHFHFFSVLAVCCIEREP